MKYDDETARSLIERHGLSRNTLHTWRHRGLIPDRYTRDDYQPPVALSDKEQHLKRQLIELLKNDKLHLANMCIELDLEVTRLHDLIKGKARFNPDLLKQVKVLLKKLQLSIRKELAGIEKLLAKPGGNLMSDQVAGHLYEMIKNPYVHHTLIVKQLGMKGNDLSALINYVEGKTNGGSRLDEARRQTIIDGFVQFVFETQIN